MLHLRNNLDTFLESAREGGWISKNTVKQSALDDSRCSLDTRSEHSRSALKLTTPGAQIPVSKVDVTDDSNLGRPATCFRALAK